MGALPRHKPSPAFSSGRPVPLHPPPTPRPTTHSTPLHSPQPPRFDRHTRHRSNARAQPRPRPARLSLCLPTTIQKRPSPPPTHLVRNDTRPRHPSRRTRCRSSMRRSRMARLPQHKRRRSRSIKLHFPRPPLIVGPENPRPEPWPGNHCFIMELTHGQPHQPRHHRVSRFVDNSQAALDAIERIPPAHQQHRRLLESPLCHKGFFTHTQAARLRVSSVSAVSFIHTLATHYHNAENDAPIEQMAANNMVTDNVAHRVAANVP